MDNYQGLEELIEIEIVNLDRLSKELNELLSGGLEKKNFIEIRAAGSILHD